MGLRRFCKFGIVVAAASVALVPEAQAAIADYVNAGSGGSVFSEITAAFPEASFQGLITGLGAIAIGIIAGLKFFSWVKLALRV